MFITAFWQQSSFPDEKQFFSVERHVSTPGIINALKGFQITNREFHWMRWMNHFMAGFSLKLSFFKLLNLQGVADSYSTYDVIAKNGTATVFYMLSLELLLGVRYLIGFQPEVITFC